MYGRVRPLNLDAMILMLHSFSAVQLWASWIKKLVWNRRKSRIPKQERYIWVRWLFFVLSLVIVCCLYSLWFDWFKPVRSLERHFGCRISYGFLLYCINSMTSHYVGYISLQFSHEGPSSGFRCFQRPKVNLQAGLSRPNGRMYLILLLMFLRFFYFLVWNSLK